MNLFNTGTASKDIREMRLYVKSSSKFMDGMTQINKNNNSIYNNIYIYKKDFILLFK